MIELPVNSIRNIVVVGETGVGKSSLINLVTGTDGAVTGSDARGLTKKTESYDWLNDGQTLRLWDTPGLNEGSNGTISSKQAQDVIRSLLTELSEGGGVHLLVLCMRGLPKVTKGMKQTYDIIVRIRDKAAQDIPLVAVLTDLEKRSAMPDIFRSMDEWWTDNAAALSNYDMVFSGHACITTLPDNCHPKLAGRHDLCQGLVRHAIVMATSPRLNIVITGEIGVGKSSLVNLVLNSECAVVVNDFTSPEKTATRYYDWEENNQVFRLWDTPGLGEGLHGRELQLGTQETLRPLFLDLYKRGGVHLLVICISGISGITTAAKKTYDLIMRMRDRFSPTTPVVAVITGLEDQLNAADALVSMEGCQWMTNSGTFSDHGMTFSGHACITTLPDNCHPQLPGRREKCRELVCHLIANQSLPLRPAPSKDLHVLLFGEAGVGKSSLINLLAGSQVASVSPDSRPCTLDSSEYEFLLGGSTIIRLWDTVGLEEPENLGPNGYVSAIEKVVQLIRRLNASGGISLFLFCIRGNRITTTTQGNYRLFYEVLGREEVPIALAVTHLEREADMEDWWQRNGQMLEKNGILSAGHACITALAGHSRYAESKVVLQGLLTRFVEQDKFSMPSEAWIGRILKGLVLLVEKSFPNLVRILFPKGKDLVSILTKRCHLDLDVAHRVAACIGTDSR